MKKLILFSILIFGIGFISIVGQQTEQQITVKDEEPQILAIREFTGPYDTMTQKIMEYVQVFFEQGLTPSGPLYSVYYNSPSDVKPEELKWACGFAVTKSSEVKEPLIKKEINLKSVITYLHIGSYDKFPEVYEKLMKYAADNGYKIIFPTYERYFNSPMDTKPEELRTEILIPVEKK